MYLQSVAKKKKNKKKECPLVSLPTPPGCDESLHTIRQKSIRERIEIAKRNPYFPSLEKIWIMDANTGESYNLADIDRILNN